MFVYLVAPLAALLAPGPHELESASLELDARIARMTAIGEALGRVHDAWGEQLAAGKKPDPCVDPTMASLVARSRAFGGAYRDAVQSSKTQSDRLNTLWTSPTVEPLLDEQDRLRAALVRTTIDHHVAIYSEMVAWQSKFIEPAAKKCPTVALSPAAGFPWKGAVAIGEDKLATAIYAIGPGVVCPSKLPTDRVIVVQGGVCIDDGSCACVASHVDPGAVLISTPASVAPEPTP